jgi:mRNA interferase HicA
MNLFERIRMLGKARNVVVRFDARHGKGSHGRLYYGHRFTTVKDRKQEIGPGLAPKYCSLICNYPYISRYSLI